MLLFGSGIAPKYVSKLRFSFAMNTMCLIGERGVPGAVERARAARAGACPGVTGRPAITAATTSPPTPATVMNLRVDRVPRTLSLPGGEGRSLATRRLEGNPSSVGAAGTRP